MLLWTAVTVVAVVGFNQIAKIAVPSVAEGTAIAFRAVPESAATADITQLAELLNESRSSELIRPPVQTDRVWITFDARRPIDLAGQRWGAYWPSRHVTAMECWSGNTSLSDIVGANALRGSEVLPRGALHVDTLLPGYSYMVGADVDRLEVLCRASFKGPARITARVLSESQLEDRIRQREAQGNVLLGAMGALVVFTLLIAIASRSLLYGTLAAWLAVNMAMAAFSIGMDTKWYVALGGIDAAHDFKKVVAAAYLGLTVLLFLTAFAQELASLPTRRGVQLLRWIIGLALAGTILLPYNFGLLFLWTGAGICALIGTWLMVQVLGAHNSKAARWYVASIMATISGSLGEVASAAVGAATPSAGFDSISAALLAAVLTSLAIAEQFNASQSKAIHAERRLRKAYDESPVGLLTLQANGTITYANQACNQVLQYSGSLVGLNLGNFVGDSNVERFRDPYVLSAGLSRQWQFRCQLGEPAKTCFLQVTASIGELDSIDATLQDVTAVQTSHEQLSHLAQHDPLTDAFNRRGLMNFQSALDSTPGRLGGEGNAELPRPTYGLAFLDLDKFKLVNDLYGHAIGDDLLQQTCQRIRSLLTPGDCVARVGGDEFVLLLEGRSGRDLTLVCEQIIHAVTQVTYLVEGLSLKVGISVGLIKAWRDHFSSLSEALSSADTLCRIAKRKDGMHLICADPNSEYFDELRDQLYISGFLDKNEVPPDLFLVMQPELSIAAPASSLNFEILIRMRRPDGSVIPALRIISAAESLGKSSLIDRWVVETALAWIDRHWNTLVNTQFIGVNLSGGSLNDIAFMTFLNMCFETHRQALSKVLFEITETVALADIEGVKAFVRQAKEQGAKFALDDFGAGFSSFGYLKGLPADALKLDGSLVVGAVNSPASVAIIANVTRLSADLGMKSVAEFVEDVQTLDMLSELGVDYAQGYAVSPPLPPERILAARSTLDLVVDARVRAYLENGRDQAQLPLLQ